MGDGSYLYFVRYTEIHARVRRRHCIIHFQQSVRFVAIDLRDQRRGLSARHYRVNDSLSSRCRRIYPHSIGTRLIDGNWYVCDYVVVFLLDTRCGQMERIHRSNSVEPYRGILVQRCRPSLCLYRIVFSITAKERRPVSVELMSQCSVDLAGDARVEILRLHDHRLDAELRQLLLDRRSQTLLPLWRSPWCVKRTTWARYEHFRW